MSNQPKSNPTFSFGIPTTSSGSSGLFGLTSTASNTSGGLFASNTSLPSAPGSAFSGASSGTPTSSASNLFGGGGTTTSVPGQQSLIGGGASTGQTGSIFGAQGASGSTALGGAKGNGAFAGFSTPSKPVETSTAGAGTSTSLFGGARPPGTSSLFGNAGITSGQVGSTTPAPSKPGGAFSFGTVSTTPAGPPPSSNAGTSTSGGPVFSLNKPAEQKTSLFGNLAPAQSLSQTSAPTAAPSNLFGASSKPNTGSLFGQTKPAGASTPTTATSSLNLFGNIPSTSGPSLFTNKDAPAQNQSGGLTYPTLGGGASSAVQPSQAGTTQPTFTFPKLGDQKPLTAATNQAPGPTTTDGKDKDRAAPTWSFPSAGTSQATTPAVPSSTGPTSNAGAAPSLFGNLGAPSMTSPASTGQGVSQPTSSATTAASSGPSTTSNAAQQPATNNNSSCTNAQPGGISDGDTTQAASSNLGASTAGPRPPPQSRLRNKTMDEIITRWAADLSKYQKQFQADASKIAEWDRMLVENSDKIQKLYGSTLEAERATVEVERQLSTVENGQRELEGWLDSYEAQVEEMMAGLGGEGMQGPDQERERTYKLAERLSERLVDMGKDLTSMIEEINDASSILSKNNKEDDPLSQIVRVLNGHLAQLQQIDQGAAALQAKVQVAQKSSRTLGAANGMNGLGSDAANDFYRSYMGRR